MKKSFSVLAIFWLTAVLVFTTAAFGEEEYRAEISAEYLSIDSGSDMETTLIGFTGEVFFEPVKTADHPYAEASFLERIGSVNASIADVDMEIATVDGSGTLFSAGVTYAKPGFPLAFLAQYSTVDVDADDVDVTIENNGYELSIGNFFAPALLAGIQYSYDKTDIESPFEAVTDKSTGFGLFVKSVHKLEQSAALNLEGSIGQSKSDDGTESLTNTEIALSADYYFNRSLSAGAGFITSSGDNEFAEGNGYSARIRYFLAPQFSIAASYDKFDGSEDDDEKTIDLILAVRF